MRSFQILCLGVIASFCATAAFALELKFGHIDPPQSLPGRTAAEFARRANARLHNAEVTVYDNSQIGDDVTLLQKVKSGEITFSMPESVMSTVSDEFGVFELPFLVLTRDHIKRVRGVLLDKYLQPAAQKKGYRILAVWELGFRHITNNVKPIQEPQDLRDIKLRVPKGSWRIRAFQSFGANTITIPYGKVYESLKSGEIDGQENPLDSIVAMKFDNVQKYLSLTGHVYTPAFLVVSEEHFGKLPRNIQEAIRRTAKEMEEWANQAAIDEEKNLVKQLEKTIRVNEIDKLAFLLASRPIYSEFAKSVPNGKQMISILYDRSTLSKANQ